MSDRQKNHVLILLGIVTSVLTIGGTMMQVGSLKGELITKVNEHARKLDHHDAKLEKLSDDVTDLKARVHGVASQIGKLPGQVAARIHEEEGD